MSSIFIKTNKQIEKIRKSCHLAADTLFWLESHVKPGVSTEELNNLANDYITTHGGTAASLNYMGYPKSICTSINEVICHGIPNKNDILKEGDIINIDIATVLNGYFGDTAKMFAVGKISPEAEKLLAVTQDCLNIGLSQVRPRNKFWQIGKAIQDYATKRGFAVVDKFCGHGVGLKFHELPQVYHNYLPEYEQNSPEMLPGMIFTVEPMICSHSAEARILADGWTAVTIDGGLSAQYEHTVLVTDSGFEILTN